MGALDLLDWVTRQLIGQFNARIVARVEIRSCTAALKVP